MPLKHLTETVLVFTLGLVIVLTGILLPTLPSLPPGILPWMIIFVLTLLYPISLYPLLKRNRADYFFRLLHFLPVAMATLWLLLELLMLRWPSVRSLLSVYLFAWTLPAVCISFVLIAWFCLSVIRRRFPRLFLLGLLLVPFLALALSSQGVWQGDRLLAGVLWRGGWWNITGVAQQTQSGATASSRPPILAGSGHSLPPVVFRPGQGGSSSRPTRLASAGPEDVMGAVALLLLPMYTAVLHYRVRKNRRA